jgi:hypothetical protein
MTPPCSCKELHSVSPRIEYRDIDSCDPIRWAIWHANPRDFNRKKKVSISNQKKHEDVGRLTAANVAHSAPIHNLSQNSTDTSLDANMARPVLLTSVNVSDAEGLIIKKINSTNTGKNSSEGFMIRTNTTLDIVTALRTATNQPMSVKSARVESSLNRADPQNVTQLLVESGVKVRNMTMADTRDYDEQFQMPINSSKVAEEKSVVTYGMLGDK